MPIMDGLDLVKELAARADLLRIPILVMSALDEATLRSRCKAQQDDDCLES
jgi:CheY-like chemotaxis protein